MIRRRWDSNPRYLSVSLVFKTSSLNHSDTSPYVFYFVALSQATHLYYHFFLHMSTTFFNFFLFRKCQVFLQHFFKKIFNIVYLLFIIYNDIIRLQLQLFLSSFLKKCIEKRLSSGSHFLYAPLSFILLIFPFH